jgi:NitT/TauT family transport system substrate-binding protein
MLRRLSLMIALFAWIAAPSQAAAEANVVRVAKQFGVGYMQYMVMQELKLVEKYAKAAGLDITTEWATFRSSDVMNDALISGMRLAPKSTSTMTRMIISSLKPRLPNMGIS